MRNSKHRQSEISSKGLLFFLLMVTSLLPVGGCGKVDFQAGQSFDSVSLESGLIAGVSNGVQVQAALGKPFGKGRALMPFHESPRTVWTYYFEQGSVDLGGGDSKDNRKYLFVFLAEDTYEGYMWFESQLQSD